MVGLVGRACSMAAAAETAHKPNPIAEQWVAQQVASGREALLAPRFPRLADRVLSASFFDRILTTKLKSVKAQRNGVVIRDAVFAEEINLDTAVIPHDVQLKECTFERLIFLPNAVFRHGVSFEKSRFDGLANFENIKVAGTAWFRNATFAGPVNFLNADIREAFDANGARFLAVADFTSMKVGRTVFFNDVVFDGIADFRRMQIGQSLELNAVHFNHATYLGKKEDIQQHNVTFEAMKVGDDVWLIDAVFAGSASFAYANIAGNLEAMKIKFTNEDRRHRAYFRGMKAQAGYFHNAVFKSRVVLKETTFQFLNIPKVKWPSKRNRVELDGMTYQYISADPPDTNPQDVGTWRNLLDLANHAKYSADVYTNLESFFARQGYSNRADQVFIALKRRERAEVLHGFAWCSSWLLDVLVRHGRNPGYALLWSGVFLLIGCFIIRRPEEMEATNPDPESAPFSPFWYCMDCFVPFVDLKADDDWKIKPHRKLALLYMRVLSLMGWVLIPIGLAALTGNLK